jgi:hypothetical protein
MDFLNEYIIKWAKKGRSLSEWIDTCRVLPFLMSSGPNDIFKQLKSEVVDIGILMLVGPVRVVYEKGGDVVGDWREDGGGWT